MQYTELLALDVKVVVLAILAHRVLPVRTRKLARIPSGSQNLADFDQFSVMSTQPKRNPAATHSP
jgi:hypothetical protein